MRQILSILLIVLLSTVMVGRGTKSRSKASVNKEKTEVRKKIDQTQQKIQANKAKTASLLSELNTLQAQIQMTNDTIRLINGVIVDLSVREKLTADSITSTQEHIQAMESECERQLRQSRRQRKSMSTVALVVSSQSMQQAMKRTAYIRQLNKSILRRADQLGIQRQALEAQRANLAEMKSQQQALADALAAQRQILMAKQAQTADLVDGLKREGEALAAVLQDQRAMSQRLDNELNAIIAEEQRRAEEQRLAEERRRKAAERAAAEREARQRQTAQATASGQQGSTAQSAQPKTAAPSADAPSTRPKRQTTAQARQTAESSGAIAKHGSTFAANKGSMSFPVTGRYTIIRTFGVSQHDDLPYVQTDNPGIDIRADGDTSAMSIFEGTVSSVSHIDGYHNVVMVRHGEYITIYAGIDKLSVHKGDKVKAGQTLGQIYKGDNGAVLHFEVRKETQKLNPLEWVKR